MTMLLTLAVRSLQRMLSANGADRLTLLDTPDFAIKQLQLRGMNVPTSLLAGWSLPQLDRLRDRADKASCPCLVLVEDTPLAFADPNMDVREEAADRVTRLATAAHRLGCNALAVRLACADTEDALDIASGEIKAAIRPIERLELNLLISPQPGLTHSPERLTEFIKRIGGFRIGILPDFAHAAEVGDMVQVLRKLAPYAGALHATVQGFTKRGVHKGYDLAEGVKAVRSVGFLNTIAIDYTGDEDPVENIEKARVILQEAIDLEAE